MRLNVSEIVTKPMVDPQWVVKGILPRGSLAILAGEQGIGKTSICYHLALCTSLGLPLFNAYEIERTKVLYIDHENGLPDSERYWQRAWLGLRLGNPEKLEDYLRVEHFSLGRKWEQDLLAFAKDFEPGLIVIDTAGPVLNIMDENDNAEASRKISALRLVQLAANNNTAILVLKHEKMRDEVGHRRTIRGAKTWLGQVDIVMYYHRGKGGRGPLRHAYLEADKPRAFGLDHVVEVVPSWSQDKEPKGLVFNAHRAKNPDD